MASDSPRPERSSEPAQLPAKARRPRRRRPLRPARVSGACRLPLAGPGTEDTPRGSAGRSGRSPEWNPSSPRAGSTGRRRPPRRSSSPGRSGWSTWLPCRPGSRCRRSRGWWTGETLPGHGRSQASGAPVVARSRPKAYQVADALRRRAPAISRSASHDGAAVRAPGRSRRRRRGRRSRRGAACPRGRGSGPSPGPRAPSGVAAEWVTSTVTPTDCSPGPEVRPQDPPGRELHQGDHARGREHRRKLVRGLEPEGAGEVAGLDAKLGHGRRADLGFRGHVDPPASRLRAFRSGRFRLSESGAGRTTRPARSRRCRACGGSPGTPSARSRCARTAGR